MVGGERGGFTSLSFLLLPFFLSAPNFHAAKKPKMLRRRLQKRLLRRQVSNLTTPLFSVFFFHFNWPVAEESMKTLSKKMSNACQKLIKNFVQLVQCCVQHCTLFYHMKSLNSVTHNFRVITICKNFTMWIRIPLIRCKKISQKKSKFTKINCQKTLSLQNYDFFTFYDNWNQITFE